MKSFISDYGIVTIRGDDIPDHVDVLAECGETTRFWPVDRRALLQIADDMEHFTWFHSEEDHRLAAGFAGRIREACGCARNGSEVVGHGRRYLRRIQGR